MAGGYGGYGPYGSTAPEHDATPPTPSTKAQQIDHPIAQARQENVPAWRHFIACPHRSGRHFTLSKLKAGTGVLLDDDAGEVSEMRRESVTLYGGQDVPKKNGDGMDWREETKHPRARREGAHLIGQIGSFLEDIERTNATSRRQRWKPIRGSGLAVLGRRQ